MLWLELAHSQENYSRALYSSLQNTMAQYSFGSVIYFVEKRTKNCENQNNVRECKLSCVNKAWLRQHYIYT
jgi:deoxyadenosine/deoxycytidine kinase